MDEFRVAQVYRLALALARKRPLLFLALALVIDFPGLVLGWNQVPQDIGSQAPGAAELVDLLLAQVLTAALSFAAVMTVEERPVNFRKSLEVALVQLLTVVIVGLIPGIAFYATTWQALLIVPALFLLTMFYPAVPIAVAEQRGVLYSLRRSAELTRGRRLKIFAVLLFLSFAVLAITNGVAEIHDAAGGMSDEVYVLLLFAVQLLLGIANGLVAGSCYVELARTAAPSSTS